MRSRSVIPHYLTFVLLGILMYLNNDLWNANTTVSVTRINEKNDTLSSLPIGSTGTTFLGNKIRKYKARKHLLLYPPSSHKSRLNFPSPTNTAEDLAVNCDQWAVVTTILKPTVALEKVIALASKWCLVIVGDEITPDKDYKKLAEENKDVFYLSAEYQKNRIFRRDGFVSKLPFRSFARKNVGYLFAIYNGAKVIFDFDDDNNLVPLKDGTFTPPPFLWNEPDNNVTTDIWQESSMVLKFIDDDEGKKKDNELSFNPYKYMGPSLSYSWPRGFPIDHLQDDFKKELKKIQLGDLPHSAIGVIQALCNGDPDTDAVFRMTRPQSTDFTFDRTAKSLPLLVPRSSYSPYNAQATTHMRAAFWGLYLPISVPGRVTDIWRSYIVQRIMKDVGLYLVYTPPIVEHKRSSHNYLSDHAAETDLYHKTSKLLEHLDRWSSSKEHLAERIFDLWVDLYEHDYIEVKDVAAILEWLNTLTMNGYEFPKPLSSSGTNAELPRLQPSLEDQPYRAKPYYNIKSNEGGVIEERPENAVVKIILMTMDEWPLLKGWVTYHGELFGFQNLYIIDSSTDEHAISFLSYARDILGVNVLFSNANLNELESILTEIGNNISGSSDFIIKVDTDEYLSVFDDKSQMLNPFIVKGYLSDFKYNDSHPLRQYDDNIGMCVSYAQNTVPSQEVCDKDIRANVEKFPLSRLKFLEEFWIYKAVYDSRFIHKHGINLGGHAHAFNKACIEKAAFGIIHAHSRCIEMEQEMNKRVMERHGIISSSDSKDDIISKLKNYLRCKMVDKCSCKGGRENIDSWHKVPPLITWLLCPEKLKENYYSTPLNETVTNKDFVYAMTSSLQKYGSIE